MLQNFREFSRRRRARYKTLNLITLSRAAALHNVALLQRGHSGMSIIPVLKANAYGHGLTQMAEILNEAHIDFLAVDGYFEAAKIRHLTKHHILVMGYILPDNVRLLDTKRCSFVVQDIAGLEAFVQLRKPVRIHLELNTGMNRLGLQPHELDDYLAALKRFPHLILEGIMTHLADADNESDDSYTKSQVEQFDALVEKIKSQGFTPRFIHIAQTAGSTKVQSTHANALRLGIGLYGINPLGAQDTRRGELSRLEPVLELTSTIIKTIDLRPGHRVSDNGTFTASKATRIGVLPLGYYEGVPREYSNKGLVTAGPHVLPIVGRVCMNHTMINLEGTRLAVGDKVVVISRDKDAPNSAESSARKHNLFTYSALTSLSSSVRRDII